MLQSTPHALILNPNTKTGSGTHRAVQKSKHTAGMP
jgi:hypothetical protein